MNYDFKMKNGKVLRWYYNNLFKDEKKNIFGHVSLNQNNREYTRTVRGENTGRKFFTWNKEKVYMDSFQAYSPEELVKAFQTGDEYVSGDDICHTLEKYGMDSLRLLIKTKKLDIISIGGLTIKMKTSSSFDKEEDFSWIEYEFVEDYLRMPEDGYKLEVMPSDKSEKEIYPKEDFYICDLSGLLSRRQDLFKLILPRTTEFKQLV